MRKIVLLFILLISFNAFAQNKQQPLDSLFSQLNKEGKFFGNVLIAEGGTVIYQQSFGKADMVAGNDLNAESMFELASVSKQFTAMGIMLLKKQGKLDYSDSLRKFFPELPYSNITIRHLLNHTSGLPDYMDQFNLYWDSTRIATNKDMISLLAQYKPPVLFAPGEKWEYSNTGYALLASIIEKASGKSFGDYLEENIFIPLGMKRTMVYRRRYEKKVVDNYAFGYVYDTRKKKYVLPDDLPETATLVHTLDGISGDGTVNATTGDLLKWDRALKTEKLVRKAMMEEAFTDAPLNNGKTYNYGFGWFIGKLSNGSKMLNHSGGWPGYNIFIERHPVADKTIIILRNYDGASLPLQKVRNILYDIKETASREITVNSDVLKTYEGEYELAPEFIITITTENGKIFAQATGQPKFELFPEKEDLFFLKVVEAKIKFIKDGQQKVTSLVLYQNGQEIPGSKIK